ncbi:MAG: hypothetical protein IPG60_03645 [Bacteroidetes bacterium]|nr:hypothetical protein [Bacteroidota bacterium]
MKNTYIVIKLIIVCTSAAFILMANIQGVNAQGCVSVRSLTGEVSSGNNVLDKGDMQIGLGYRYFHSYKHFRGTEEEIYRVDEGTDVRNDVNAFDLIYTYGINQQWSATVDLPYTFNYRSSKYEHGNDPATGVDVRKATHSNGIGDIRLQADRWMLDTYKENLKGNFSLGAGIKFPTGNFAFQDTFYYIGNEGANVFKEVDQSIQLGDGGWGFSLQTQGYAQLETEQWFVYYSIYYLFTPGDTLSWQKRVDKIDPANPPAVNYSIPDQFLIRGGFTYSPSRFAGMAFNLGFRFEGIPGRDAFGETNGKRRPGKVAAIDPGATYIAGNHIFSLSVPISVYRNRTQSVQDIERQQVDPGPPGDPRHGDAAFSDYTVFFNYSYRLFNKKHHDMME